MDQLASVGDPATIACGECFSQRHTQVVLEPYTQVRGDGRTFIEALTCPVCGSVVKIHNGEAIPKSTKPN